jgi:carbon monoxide dehydrogenase subunit G
MKLLNEFVVPRGVEETWRVLTDIERIAPAMPGAALTDVADGVYHGTVKVKVGPVSAQYAGVASFREVDEANRHLVLEATGKESSGRGRASAVVTADLEPEGSETRVRVVTELSLSGPLAQFGRGAIAEVSARLLNQFVTQLRTTVLDAQPAPVAAPVAGAAAPAEPDAVAESVAGPSALEPEVDLVRVAAWPVLKRALPLAAGVVLVVVALVWLFS